MKTAIPCRFVGAAALALIVSASTLQAEIEMKSLVVEDADIAHGIEESVDPIVRDEILGLRSNGLMGIQSEVGTDLLLIERYQRRAQALEQMMSSLGTDGLRQFNPELYASLEQSPIFIRQKIAELELQRQLENIMNGDGSDDAQDELERLMSQMGGNVPFDIFNYPPFAPAPPGWQAGGPEGFDIDFPQEEDSASGIEDLFEETVPEPMIIDFPISLREIHGASGVYRAVILHGDELIRIEAGDRLPNDTEILDILQDRIQIRRRDTVLDIHIRG